MYGWKCLLWPNDKNVGIKYAIGNAGYTIYVLFLFCIKDVLFRFDIKGSLRLKGKTRNRCYFLLVLLHRIKYNLFMTSKNPCVAFICTIFMTMKGSLTNFITCINKLVAEMGNILLTFCSHFFKTRIVFKMQRNFVDFYNNRRDVQSIKITWANKDKRQFYQKNQLRDI